MYSPALFPANLYTLWNQDQNRKAVSVSSGSDKSVSASTTSSSIMGSITTNSNRPPTAEQILIEERKQSRLLFAPPLQAYSAEVPGANAAELEFTIQSTNLLPGYRNVRKFVTTTPLIQSKIDQLTRIRMTGYLSIRPIGINKTLEQIDYENARSYAYDEDGEGDDHDHGHNHSYGNAAAENSHNHVDIQEQLVHDQEDLDANIVDGDADADDDYEVEEEEEEGEGQGQGDAEEQVDDTNRRYFSHRLESVSMPLDDEGFMADEVEYQDDHSLSADYVINSAATFATSMNNTGRSIITNTTTIASSISPIQSRLIRDENDEEYETSMVVEGN
ncbi:uncharacterized protein RJT21DRAFT_41956 [Scheffersomyces amazonensis]|uniref:uncharacterized protein n=1 Tax=Scheffersomyces amazonensis TaxID=1078765 RepID=UPI00315DE28C